METFGQQDKVASSPQAFLWIFLQIQNKFWRYAELNRFWVGWTKFPFYELGQQEWGQGCIRYKCDLKVQGIQEVPKGPGFAWGVGVQTTTHADRHINTMNRPGLRAGPSENIKIHNLFWPGSTGGQQFTDCLQKLQSYQSGGQQEVTDDGFKFKPTLILSWKLGFSSLSRILFQENIVPDASAQDAECADSDHDGDFSKQGGSSTWGGTSRREGAGERRHRDHHYISSWVLHVGYH